MRVQYNRNAAKPRGYTLWLTAAETERWAHKPGAVWPCSTLSGRSVRVDIDSNGLYGLAIGGPRSDDPDLGAGGELEALVADHLPAALRHLWPCWARQEAAGNAASA